MGNDLANVTENTVHSLLISHFSNGSIQHPGCEICNSPFREDAERMFDEGKAFSDIRNFLSTKGGSVHINSVSHHMKEHYKNLERMAVLLDYCDHLEEIGKRRRARRNDLELLVDMCIADLASIASLVTKNDIAKQKMKIELAVKVRQDMRAHLEVLNNMEDKEEAIRAIEIRFANAWKTCIDKAESTQEKQLYAQALREFQKTLEEYNS